MTLDDALARISDLQRAPDWKKLGEFIRSFDALPVDAEPTLFGHAIAAVETAAMSLVAPTSQHTEFNIGVELFMVPSCLARRQGPLRQAAFWQAKRTQFQAILAQRVDGKSLSFAIGALLICDSILKSPAEGLGVFVANVTARGPSRFMAGLATDANELRSLLINNGWVAGSLEPFGQSLTAFAERLAHMPGAEIRDWVGAIIKIFYYPTMPDRVLQLVHTLAVVPILRRAADVLDADLIQVARTLDNRIQTTYQKASESAERSSDTHRQVAPLLHAIGQRARRDVLRVEKSQFTPSPNVRLRIGFFLHTPNLLAHTINLFTFFRGLSRLDPLPIEPYLYVLGAGLDNPAVTGQFGHLPLKFRAPDREVEHPAAWLRQVAQQDGIAAIVFISNTAYLSFAGGFSVAPALVWWAMKYHSLDDPGIDGYLSVGNFFDEFVAVGGRRWRSARMALPPLTNPQAVARGAILRQSLGLGADDVLLGCIGREEKLLDAGFMDALARILSVCPNTRFMWTGRKMRVAHVRAMMAERGILERCPFVGWLPDTQAGVQALDIFLDTFPFASGHVGYEAMAAGKPLIVLRTPEALETSTATSLVPLYERLVGHREDQDTVRAIFTDNDGSSLLPYPKSVEDYVALAIRLVKEPDYRTRVGSACRTYVERYARDEVTCARTTCQHLIDIVREKAVANGGFITF